jgi:ankyrin repeat protein
MYAAITNSILSLKMLHEAGADLTMRDLDGNTALHLAYMYNSRDCVRFLETVPGIEPESLNMAGKSPLDMAGRGKAKAIQSALYYCTGTASTTA